MPFSSYRRWPFHRHHSPPLLPSSAKQKLSPGFRKPRRSQPLISFLLSNLTILAVTLALLFFFLTLFLFVSNPRSYQALGPPVSNRVRSVKQRSLNGSVSAASFDITTKELYDRIVFKNEDGGAWKQGWNVMYRGDEWDGERLKVSVVPDSHNDPGWKLTIEEYYDTQSRHILNTIVESLSQVARLGNFQIHVWIVGNECQFTAACGHYSALRICWFPRSAEIRDMCSLEGAIRCNAASSLYNGRMPKVSSIYIKHAR